MPDQRDQAAEERDTREHFVNLFFRQVLIAGVKYTLLATFRRHDLEGVEVEVIELLESMQAPHEIHRVSVQKRPPREGCCGESLVQFRVVPLVTVLDQGERVERSRKDLGAAKLLRE